MRLSATGGKRSAGVVHAEGRAGPAMKAQNLLGVRFHPRIDAQGPIPHVCALDIDAGQPGLIARHLADLALAEEHDIHDHIRAGIGAHGAGRQTYGAQELGFLVNEGARTGVGLVERVTRDHECRDVIGAQGTDRAGQEPVMERQPLEVTRLGLAHGTVRERRIADRQIVARAQLGTGEVLCADPLLGIELRGDARREWVHLDAGEGDLALELLRARCDEQACPATRLQDGPACKAARHHEVPHGMDNRFRGVVGILGRACEGATLCLGGACLQIGTQLFPPGAIGFIGAG